MKKVEEVSDICHISDKSQKPLQLSLEICNPCIDILLCR